jgi:2-polyprenyl-6-methoxyphenol hydroxylase-like FAD-dependent oxidoreductase
MTSSVEHFDVVIVGAGFAGLSLAHGLAGRDLEIAIVDKRDSYPNLFRAEKIEPRQAESMRRLGTLEMRAPLAGPIGKTLNVSGDKVETFDTVEQYGIAYGDTVNNLKRQLPADIRVITDTVSDIVPGKHGTISMDSGSVLHSKLVVIASGFVDQLSASLAIRRKDYPELRSLSFGFDIRRADGAGFTFNGLNYFPSETNSKILYMTVFPIGDRMRVNLFTRLDPKDPMAKQLRDHTLATLVNLFPKLCDFTGEIELDSRIQSVPTNYYRVTGYRVPGVVLVGDAFQSVSPATGSGLSKVLTDVECVIDCFLSRWKDYESISARDVMSYYRHREKRGCDRRSLQSWYYADYNPCKAMALPEKVSRRLRLALKVWVARGVFP